MHSIYTTMTIMRSYKGSSADYDYDQLYHTGVGGAGAPWTFKIFYI